jgi:hypothetical protein
MIRVWASLSGKVCETSLMKKMRPSLLLRQIGIDASMSCARSVARKFLSFVFKQCSLYSCEASDMRSIIFASANSFISVPAMLSGRSKYISFKEVEWFRCFICWLVVCDILVPSYGRVFGFC